MDKVHKKFKISIRTTVHEDVQDKLKEFSKPAEQWTDDPDEYIIVGSDPPEE